MSNSLSKVLLGLEAVLLGIPACMWLLWVLFPVLLFPSKIAMDSIGKLVAILIVVQLFAAYRVIVRFLSSGAHGLRLMSPAWWWLCGLGVVNAMAGILVIVFGVGVGPRDNILELMLRFASCGILYCVPLGHILLEMWIRRAAPHVA